MTKVETTDIQLSNTGRFLSCNISITLEEYSDGKKSKLIAKAAAYDKNTAISATATNIDRASKKPGKALVTAL